MHRIFFIIFIFIYFPLQADARFWLSGQYGPSTADSISLMMMGGDIGFSIDGDKAGIGAFYLQSETKTALSGTVNVQIKHTMYGLEALVRGGAFFVGGKFALDRYCGSASVLGSSRVSFCQNYFAIGPYGGFDLRLLGPLSIGAEASAFIGVGAPMYIMAMGLGVVRLSF